MSPRRHRLNGKRRVAAFALAAVLVSCVVPSAADARTFAWKATSQSGGVVYLVGSVHLLSADYYPLNPSLDAAYKDSSALVEEVDFGEMLSPEAQLHMLARGMLPGGQTIDSVVSPATMTLVNKALADAGGSLGLPVDQLKRFKPWMLALTLMDIEWQKAGFDPNLGLDKHFFDEAKRDNKPVEGLETVDYQIARFDGMPMADQDRLLAESMTDTELADVKVLANAWKEGDDPAVSRIVLDDLSKDPDLYQRLLVERNRNWFPRIEALFRRPAHALVVVGAAHLVGPDGLLSMLKAKGYKVEQL